jgi:hypothetical protein
MGHPIPVMARLFDNDILATMSLNLEGYKRVSLGDGNYAWRRPGWAAFSNRGPGGVVYVTYVKAD